MHGFLSLLALAGTLAASANAQQWARFRGPAGQGIAAASDLPPSFTAAHERWRVASGVGHSSPVVWGPSVYLTRAAVAQGTRQIVVFDADTGEERWAHTSSFEPHALHRLNSHASSTLVADASGVCVAWTSGGELRALALDHDGEPLWERRLGAFDAQHGGGGSAVLFEGWLVVQNEHRGEDSFLIALDRESGETHWKIPRSGTDGRTSYAAPVLWTPGDGPALLLFASTAHGVTAVDPRAGEVRWSVDLGLRTRCVAVPALCGDQLFVSAGTGGGGKEAALLRLSGEQPSIVARPRRHLPYVPAALGLADHLFLVSDGGVASCRQADTGELVWRGRLDGGFFSSPVSDGEVIHVVSRDGLLQSFAAADAFELLGSYDLGESVHATPAIAGGRMYVRTFDHLVCLGAE